MGEDVLSVGEGGFLYIQMLKFGASRGVKSGVKASKCLVIVPFGGGELMTVLITTGFISIHVSWCAELIASNSCFQIFKSYLDCHNLRLPINNRSSIWRQSSWTFLDCPFCFCYSK